MGSRGARQDRPQRRARQTDRAARKLGHRPAQPADPAGAREGRGCRPQRGVAEIPWPHIRACGRSATRRPSTSAGVRPQGGALCHLLRQLQQPGIGEADPCGTGPERRRDRGGLSAMLRDAAIRAGRSRQGRRGGAARWRRARALDRQGLRRDRPGAILRPDAEVRVAADRAGRSRRVKKLSQGHLRCRRVHR